jgi:ankyrin repeat protein
MRTLLALGADRTVRAPDGRSLTELARADGREEIAALLERVDVQSDGGASAGAPSDPHARRVATFLTRACLDWRVGGSQRDWFMHDAARILARHPEVARANLFTAVVCGDLALVERLLAERPEAAREPDGPRAWPPLLYLCNARLPLAAASEHAVAIARALLDGGADPNAFYPGGNPSIHYTALTGVLGRGEEQAATHPRAPALAALLMERGAEPYDTQVLYNVFANHASRTRLGDDIVWLLELMHAESVRRGRGADWDDPAWRMLDMGGYGHGAYYLLRAAVDAHLLGLAEWLLAHGASPDAPPPMRRNASTRTLREEAVRNADTAMAELLASHGAAPGAIVLEGVDAFVDACLRMDRERVQALLREHPEYARDPRAMFVAAERDRADVAEMLIELGVPPDIERTPSGRWRPLHEAAYRGSAGVAALLIAHGADVDFRAPEYDATPLGTAVFGGQPRTIELLGRYSRDVWELTYIGQVERLREVLRDEPALATLTSADGDTPLMWLPSDAADALEVARLLLAAGADPAARNARGVTAADLARERGLDEVARLLEPTDRGVSAPSRVARASR